MSRSTTGLLLVALVADLTRAVLRRCDDGKYRNLLQALITMTAVVLSAA